jgi:hypothetical protein
LELEAIIGGKGSVNQVLAGGASDAVIGGAIGGPLGAGIGAVGGGFLAWAFLVPSLRLGMLLRGSASII